MNIQYSGRTDRSTAGARSPLIKHAVAASPHTALENVFLFSGAIDRRTRGTPDSPVAGPIQRISADRTRGRASDGAAGCAGRGTPGHHDLVRVELAVIQSFCMATGSTPFMSMIGFRMRRATGRQQLLTTPSAEIDIIPHFHGNIPRIRPNHNAPIFISVDAEIYKIMANSSHGGTARAILYAFLANGGIAIAKTWGAMVTGSGSMMAEAIHSYADTGNQVLLFLGLKQAGRAPDAEHPLGYGKLSYFWSFIVALMLFSLGGLFSIYEGYHKFMHPGAAEPVVDRYPDSVHCDRARIILAWPVVCARSISSGASAHFRSWLTHTRNSELVVVLGEDIAALLGLVLALAFVSLTAMTGNPVYDAIGSMCIGVILIVISVFLAVRVRSLLVGKSADPMIQESIAAIIDGDDDIVEVFNVITMQFGPDTLLAAKIRMKSGTDIDKAVREINALERQLKQQVPGLKWCFIEPDIAD